MPPAAAWWHCSFSARCRIPQLLRRGHRTPGHWRAAFGSSRHRSLRLAFLPRQPLREGLAHAPIDFALLLLHHTIEERARLQHARGVQATAALPVPALAPELRRLRLAAEPVAATSGADLQKQRVELPRPHREAFAALENIGLEHFAQLAAHPHGRLAGS